MRRLKPVRTPIAAGFSREPSVWPTQGQIDGAGIDWPHRTETFTGFRTFHFGGCPEALRIVLISVDLSGPDRHRTPDWSIRIVLIECQPFIEKEMIN